MLRPPAIAALVILALARLSAAAPTPRPGASAGPEPPALVLGRAIEIRGEVVDLEGYLRDGRRGEAHRAAALASIARGGSLAIVEDDTGTLYPLAGDTPASDPSAAVRDFVAQHVAVTGRVYERARGRVLVVERVQRLD
ncbi:MAG TPA: hypothetical protein VFD92_06230 [Candidatus Binatia bacterium]|nr:hypothetical protein [Candidatus Binatia bacterium]